VDLTTTLGGTTLSNPVMTASGCGGNGPELARFCDLGELGAFVTPSVTRDGSGGRPLPRMVETPSGLLHAAGLPGAGVEAFLDRDLPWLLDRGVATIVSIAGATLGEFAELARHVGGVTGISGIEVNLASVEPAAGALRADLARGFARDPVQAARAVSVVRRDTATQIPVLAKLWPGISSIVEMAGAVIQSGADAIVLPGSLPGLVVDLSNLGPRLGGGAGVLSGPAVLPVGLHAVWEVRRSFPDATIVGAGGIRTGADALAYLAAGADAVQVGSALLFDPSAASRVSAELTEELARRGLSSLADVVAVAHTGGVT
jgi:dihydroorotate dehydrogenase (NAD+) catalytic subunit